jgi:hypothetical protein
VRVARDAGALLVARSSATAWSRQPPQSAPSSLDTALVAHGVEFAFVLGTQHFAPRHSKFTEPSIS